MRQGIRQQTLEALDSRGESITIMAVGDAGTGKTSLLSNLFHRPLDPAEDPPPGSPTLVVTERMLQFDLDGVPFSARLIDSPGYGDSLDLMRSFKVVTGHIDSIFQKTLSQERRRRRAARDEREAHMAVDVVLYFFTPHRCKAIDMAFLDKLRGRASIVPVLAKADTMTTDELDIFRREVSEQLDKAGIEVAHPPVAIICSSGDATPRGREYAWGLALSEDGEHSELPQLRRFLLIDGLLSLKVASRRHYEAYRTRALKRGRDRALVKALLAPLQLGLVSLVAPSPRRWARRQLSAALAWFSARRASRVSKGVRRAAPPALPKKSEPKKPERKAVKKLPPAPPPPPPAKKPTPPPAVKKPTPVANKRPLLSRWGNKTKKD